MIALLATLILSQASAGEALVRGQAFVARGQLDEAISLWRTAVREVEAPSPALNLSLANALRTDGVYDHGLATRIVDPELRRTAEMNARRQIIEGLEHALAAEAEAVAGRDGVRAQDARMELFLCYRSLAATDAFKLGELDLERHLRPSVKVLEAFLATRPLPGAIAEFGAPDIGVAFLERDRAAGIALIQRLAELTPGQPETALALAEAAVVSRDTALGRQAVAALRAAGQSPRADAVMRRRMQNYRIALGSR